MAAVNEQPAYLNPPPGQQTLEEFRASYEWYPMAKTTARKFEAIPAEKSGLINPDNYEWHAEAHCEVKSAEQKRGNTRYSSSKAQTFWSGGSISSGI